MKPKRILFFSCEPGGAEVLIPVINLVRKETAHQVTVLAYGLGGERFAAKGIEYIEITQVKKDDAAIFATYQPELVITSATSLPERDMSEKYLWQIAQEKGIPTLAFLDQWQNYVVRFSGVAEDEHLAYLPDFINCIDAIGETEMICAGFDPDRLVKFGQPYLSSLQESVAAIDAEKIRQQLEIAPGQRIVLFVSEAIREHYGQSRGYDQYDALRLFLDIISASGDEVIPLIKLHPKDSLPGYEQVAAEYGQLKPIFISNSLSSVECLNVADKVYGMTSIMLIEAYVLGKEVISLQPGLQGEDPLILSRAGLIPKVTDDTIEMFSDGMVGITPHIMLDYIFKNSLLLGFIECLFAVVPSEHERAQQR